MLTKASKEFRTAFLLEFTKELIKNSGTEFFQLENIVKQEEKDIKKTIHEKIKEEEKPTQLKKPLPKLIHPIIRTKKLRTPLLKIPEPRLPQNLQYLKPTPTKIEIDLEKLNPLIQDPLVTSIECHGTEEPVKVRGRMGVKKTNIVLSKEEIDNVIKKFSDAAKIPLHEGVLKIATGRLILSAIVSNIIDSKFIIKKMAYSQHPILKKPNLQKNARQNNKTKNKKIL